MSVWTHVAAVFRIDGIRDEKLYGMNGPEWDKITGRTIYECDWLTEDTYERRRMDDDWAAYHKHPKRFVPTGSEGSLQRLVWINPDGCCAAHYTVTVFGDLRDYDDHEAIHEWFDSVCDKCFIRQAVCECNVSGPVYVWRYGDFGGTDECRV